MAEIRKLKEELKEALDANANMTERLFMAQDSVKQITMMKQRLDDKEQMVQQCMASINELKAQILEADKRTESVQTELQARVNQVREGHESIKTLQVEKTALTQENKQLETQIKNLLLELSLTKEAVGDSGSQLLDLNKSLRLAQANSDKFEKLAGELKATLETRTQNFLKEKADIRIQLDKALADL